MVGAECRSRSAQGVLAQLACFSVAAELVEASEGRGSAMKKREEVHRMAEANKAFSHFRF